MYPQPWPPYQMPQQHPMYMMPPVQGAAPPYPVPPPMPPQMPPPMPMMQPMQYHSPSFPYPEPVSQTSMPPQPSSVSVASPPLPSSPPPPPTQTSSKDGCPDHPQERVTFYCPDDNAVACSKCVLTGRYAGRRCVPLKIALSQEQGALRKQAASVQEKLSTLEGVMNDVTAKIKRLPSEVRRPVTQG